MLAVGAFDEAVEFFVRFNERRRRRDRVVKVGEARRWELGPGVEDALRRVGFYSSTNPKIQFTQPTTVEERRINVLSEPTL